MRALVFNQHGGPEVLEYAEVTVPTLSPTDMLVKVHACALNHLDIYVREGIPGSHLSFPHISGGDISGVVVDVGTQVKEVAKGDRVLVDARITCGKCS